MLEEHFGFLDPRFFIEQVTSAPQQVTSAPPSRWRASPVPPVFRDRPPKNPRPLDVRWPQCIGLCGVRASVGCCEQSSFAWGHQGSHCCFRYHPDFPKARNAGSSRLGASASLLVVCGGHRPTRCCFHYCERLAVASCPVCERPCCSSHLHFDDEEPIMCVGRARNAQQSVDVGFARDHTMPALSSGDAKHDPTLERGVRLSLLRSLAKRAAEPLVRPGQRLDRSCGPRRPAHPHEAGGTASRRQHLLGNSSDTCSSGGHRPTRCTSLDCRAPATLNCDGCDRRFCGRHVIHDAGLRLCWACLLDADTHPLAVKPRKRRPGS